jgi:ATP-binding cassette subfamily B protein
VSIFAAQGPADSRPVFRRRPDRSRQLADHSDKPLRLVLRYVARHALSHGAVLAGVTVAVACSLGSQYAIKHLIDALPSGHTNLRGLRDAFWMVVVLLFADGLFWRLAGWVGVKAFVAVTGDVRRELFWYLTGHTHSYFSELQPGTLASRVSATANAIYTIENTLAWSCFRSFCRCLALSHWSGP